MWLGAIKKEISSFETFFFDGNFWHKFQGTENKTWKFPAIN